MSVCSGCHDKEVRDTFICGRCENQASHHLADQAAHYEDLVTAMARQVRMNAASDGGRAASRALGWSSMGARFLSTITAKEVDEIAAALPPARPAADAIHVQRNILVCWARTLVEEGMADDYPADTIPALACFIEAHLKELRLHEAGGELVRELRDLHRQIMKAIDTPATRTRVHVGPCPHEWTEDIEGGGVETVKCDGEVSAIFPRDESERPTIRCDSCGGVWEAEHWSRIGDKIARIKGTDELLQRALQGDAATWVTVQHAAKMLDVSERKIRRGVESHRVRFKVVGGGKKRRWYLVDWNDAATWATANAS